MAAPAALRHLFLLLGAGLAVIAGAGKETAPGGNCGCSASRSRGGEREAVATVRRYSAAANDGRSSGRGPVSGGWRLRREAAALRGEGGRRGAAFSARLLSDRTRTEPPEPCPAVPYLHGSEQRQGWFPRRSPGSPCRASPLFGEEMVPGIRPANTRCPARDVFGYGKRGVEGNEAWRFPVGLTVRLTVSDCPAQWVMFVGLCCWISASVVEL